MNRIKMMLMGAALVAASSALASAQPNDERREGRYEDRDHYRGGDRDHDRRFDRDDHRFFRDRDDRRFGDRDDRRFGGRDDRWRFEGRYVDRDDYGYRVGERRFFNGYYWNWDGHQWCRYNRGAVIYFRF